jgi:hypothetical protein
LCISFPSLCIERGQWCRPWQAFADEYGWNGYQDGRQSVAAISIHGKMRWIDSPAVFCW